MNDNDEHEIDQLVGDGQRGDLLDERDDPPTDYRDPGTVPPTLRAEPETPVEQTMPGTPSMLRGEHGPFLAMPPVDAKQFADVVRTMNSSIKTMFADSVGFVPTPVADALTEQSEDDPTDHPSHGIVERFSYNIATAMRILWEVDEGERPVADLATAIRYIEREQERYPQ